jgi:hypothetical protein
MEEPSSFLISIAFLRIRPIAVGDIVDVTASSDRINCIWLHEAPIGENLGRRISQVIVFNPHIERVCFTPSLRFLAANLLPWTTSRGTLESMQGYRSRSFETVQNANAFSVQERDVLFTLLLTSTHAFRRYSSTIRGSRLVAMIDEFMTAFSRYPFKATSLLSFKLRCVRSLSSVVLPQNQLLNVLRSF